MWSVEAGMASIILKTNQLFLYQDTFVLSFAANEKRHPPMLDDEVFRLEEICKDGTYHKRLQKAKIFTVHDFLKALNTNAKKLREEVKHVPYILFAAVVLLSS